MRKEHTPSISLPLSQAKLVLLAKAFEQSNATGDAWSQTDAQTVSLKTAHALGESARADQFLVERAKRVLDLAEERQGHTHINTKATPTRVLAFVFVALAFVLGAAIDRLGSVEHIVNLLSLPFWTVLLWNAVVYVVLIGCAIGCIGYGKTRFSLPLRNAMQWCAQHFDHMPLQRGLRGSFYTEWSALTAPLVRLHVARCLHLAAIALCLGLIVSLLVRGFGTAYWVGWESTWLSEQPETVKALLDWTYGLVPTFDTLPAIPDVETIKSLRVDQLPYLKEPVSAAPWLVRMMILLAVVVLIPRLIFVLFDTWRIRRWERHVKLSVADPYFQSLLEEQALDTVHTPLCVVAPSAASDAVRERLSHLVALWSETDDNEVGYMDYNADCVLPPQWRCVDPAPTVLVYMDATATPEQDVHGTLAQAVAAIYAPQGITRLALLLDRTQFAERNKNYPDRMNERLLAWRTLAQESGLALFVTDDTEAGQLDCLKQLRTWNGMPVEPAADAPDEQEAR